MTHSSESAGYVLGLDIGTSSARGVVYDAGATPVSGLDWRVTFRPTITEDGGVTVDEDVFLHVVFEVLDRVCAQADGQGITIRYVGVSCFWHSLLALDAGGKALTPILLWADTRASSVMRDVERRIDPQRLRGETGAGLHASYWPAKLAWLERTQSGIFAQARHFISAAELLEYRLFGKFRSSISQASGTGLLNIASCTWDEYACSVATDVFGRLSPLGDEPISGLSKAWQRRWPALAKSTWFAPTGDGACANIGCGASTPDRFAVTIGTSSAMRVVLPQTSHSARSMIASQPALWNYRVDAQRGIVGGALSEGGDLIAWLRAHVKLPALDIAEASISRRAGDAAGLTMLPFIAGERSPEWDAQARLAVTGIGLATEPIDLLQSAMESIAYQLRTIYDALVQSIRLPSLVVASGAALGKSPVWRQILANVLEHDVVTSQVAETSSRGAAMLALATAGVLPIAAAPTMLGEVHHPTGDPEPYRAARRRQMDLYERLSGRWLDPPRMTEAVEKPK